MELCVCISVGTLLEAELNMSIYHPTQIVFYTFHIYEWPLVKRVHKKVVFTYQNTQKNVSLRRLFEHPKQLCKNDW